MDFAVTLKAGCDMNQHGTYNSHFEKYRPDTNANGCAAAGRPRVNS
ncbi:hypothetical protein L195_g062180, partial [Trifolium pratense]